MKILDILLWPVRKLLLAHYVVWVHLTHTRSDASQIEARCSRAEDWLFGRPWRQ